MPPRPALGSAFTVDSTLDAVDLNPGDGVCASAAGGCALRAAIQEANALPGQDTVQLEGGIYTLTIPGDGEDAAATGDLDIADDLVIRSPLIVNGGREPGSIIDGGGLDRVFHIIGPAAVRVSGVVIRNGDVTNQFSSVAGILNSGGTVALSASAVRDNRAYGAAGIGNSGVMTLTNVEVTGNSIGGISNGAFGSPASLIVVGSLLAGNTGSFGGGIFNGTDGNVRIDFSHIMNNEALGFGGGISSNGDLTVTDSTISDNRSHGGGAIHYALGQATLTNVTISGNEAKSAGGAIFNDGDGEITLVNSTLSANKALSDVGPFGPIPGRGGAIYSLSGSINLSNVTVAANIADDFAAAIFSDEPGGGQFPDPGSVVTLKNTIVARNTVAGSVVSCTGIVVSDGHNIEDSETCELTATGDVVSTDAQLGPLAGNGGPTQTHALLAGSPAIDAGDESACPATDQRGIARPIDGDADGIAVCDIGAYEALAAVQPTASPSPTPAAEPSPTPAAVAPAELPRTGGPRGGRGGLVIGSALLAVAVPLLAAVSVGIRRRRSPRWRRPCSATRP